MTRLFWILFVLDTAGIAVLAFLASSGPSSPEGPVGGWLLLIPPIVMLVLAALVLMTRSAAVRIVGIYILGFPWIPLIVGPAWSAIQKYQSIHRFAGDDDFHGPQRDLSHAILARDAQLAKILIPLAGDLNRQYGSDTLLQFAIDQAPDRTQLNPSAPAASIEIVQALLDAGAKADLPAGRRWPLSSAMYSGPELTEMLLRAGANPNHIDDVGRPIWWQILSDDTDRGIQTLRILLDHGADWKMRDAQGGPVAWAAYHSSSAIYGSWRSVRLLIECGASWKDEQEFGQTVADMLARNIESRSRIKPGESGVVTEEMRQLQKLYGLE